MSPPIPVRLIRQVRQRAHDVCEYCHLPQASQEATFHVDHILPRSQGGPTELMNLALACVSCSLRKSARTSAVDPKTGNTAALFNPRTDDWSEHFDFTVTWKVRGRTDTGRATIEALGMNRNAIVLIRRELVLLNRFP
jgi:uncharacterized protein (TIGR02646 family)